MQIRKKQNRDDAQMIRQVPIDDIRANPGQPRHLFSEEALSELAASIRSCGVLQPLMVRPLHDGTYELVSGERRLRAARIAGEPCVPCLMTDADDRESALFALVENLQRQDLNFLEEAVALNRLIHQYALSQEEAARRIGKSQPSVANKLRLLRLPEALLRRILEYGLTERHARALLQISGEQEQAAALDYIHAHHLNVAQTDGYVSRRLEAREALAGGQKRSYIVKDVRVFLNTIARSMHIMQEAGVDAQCGRTETEDAILLSIRIPKCSGRTRRT